jgi:hypothetical protein
MHDAGNTSHETYAEREKQRNARRERERVREKEREREREREREKKPLHLKRGQNHRTMHRKEPSKNQIQGIIGRQH